MSAIGFVISQFVCLHLAKRPFQSLKEPSYYGLKNVENFYLDVNPVESEHDEQREGEENQIGVW